MIYIVEDDSNISELVVYTLKMAGFDAQSFTCGTVLFKQLENNIPELILLDIMLPGEDGIIILKKIRKTFQTHKIPVIMLTAKARNMIRLQVLTAALTIMLQSPLV